MTLDRGPERLSTMVLITEYDYTGSNTCTEGEAKNTMKFISDNLDRYQKIHSSTDIQEK